MKILGKLVINALALTVVAYLIPGFEFTGYMALVVAAVVLGVINTFIKPILQIIALPISIITFGIAAFLINVSLLMFASYIVPGFEIESFFVAVISSLALTFVSWFLHKLSKD